MRLAIYLLRAFSVWLISRRSVAVEFVRIDIVHRTLMPFMSKVHLFEFAYSPHSIDSDFSALSDLNPSPPIENMLS